MRSKNTKNNIRVEDVQQELLQLKYEINLAELINDSSVDIILVFNLNQEIIVWNKVCERYMDCSKEEALGRQLSDIFPRQVKYPLVSEGINAALQGFKYFIPHSEATLIDGYFETHLIPLKINEQSIEGVLCVMHDVSHRIKAENELKKLNISLKQKNRELAAKNEELLAFSNITSTDLMDPLRKMYTFIEMLINEESMRLSDKGRSFLRRIQASAQRMGLLTDDILAYAQLNNAEKNFYDLNLEHILKFVLESLREQITNTSAIINYDTLPHVTGSRLLIAQLFQHLIGNALKFIAPDKQPVLNISSKIIKGSKIKHPYAAPQIKYLAISFEDQGIGFDMVYSEKIFQMFQRIQHKTYPGTGIGLALCKKIMELHHGFITAESTLDMGSIFNCYFPLSDDNTNYI